MESGVEFVAVDFPQANRLTVHILAAGAEHEAAMISARTKAALAAAKGCGINLGGQRGNLDRMKNMSQKGDAASAAVRSVAAAKRNEDLLRVILDIQATGLTSRQQIANALKERGITAARGGLWSAVQVRRILPASLHRKSPARMHRHRRGRRVVVLNHSFRTSPPSQNCRWFVQGACATT
jgi:DNA invertase Pin-like site-specific DNA recombinase